MAVQRDAQRRRLARRLQRDARAVDRPARLLASRLTSSGIDTLVICGLSTSGCIRATAVDAIQLGFRPIVVEDAVGDRWQDAHDQSLADLGAKYADLEATDTVIQKLRGWNAG